MIPPQLSVAKISIVDNQVTHFLSRTDGRRDICVGQERRTLIFEPATVMTEFGACVLEGVTVMNQLVAAQTRSIPNRVRRNPSEYEAGQAVPLFSLQGGPGRDRLSATNDPNRTKDVAITPTDRFKAMFPAERG